FGGTLRDRPSSSSSTARSEIATGSQLYGLARDDLTDRAPRSIKLSRRKVRLNAEMRTACSTLADEVEKVIKSTVEPDQDCGCHTLHPQAGALFLEPATYLAHFPAPGFCCAGGEHELDAGGSALRGRRDCLFGC